jgi:hypothetical protein
MVADEEDSPRAYVVFAVVAVVVIAAVAIGAFFIFIR